MSPAPETPARPALPPTTASPWAVEVFFDGDCPLCAREVAWLRWLDRHQRICFTDLAAPGFRPESHGRTLADFTAEIQGRLPDGRWLTGVEVFRQLYAALGFRSLVAVTRWPGVAHLLDWAYRLFARNRLRLTGRCSSDGACRVPASAGRQRL